MRIAFAASEAAPFIKTGGLGDVARALPAMLAKSGKDTVDLYLPYYGSIKRDPAVKAEFCKSFPVDLSWRRQHVGVFKAAGTPKNLNVYLIDNEYYFDRPGIYGEGDDGERFAYFSKAVLETMLQMKLCPDVIHCNDWQTALIPLLLHACYHDTLGSAKTVFTIHNIEYQGKADPSFIGDVLGLPGEYRNTLLYDGCVNFMKSAILSCDALTTVSKTYAGEILYPYYAHGLSPVIADHSFKLRGIINGIDTAVFDPKHDPALVMNYDAETVAEGKAANQKALCERLGLSYAPDAAVIGMVSRLVRHKGVELLCETMWELMNWNIRLVVLGSGDAKFENALKECAAAYPEKFSLNLGFDLDLAAQIYAASDLYLMPSQSEPCGLSQLNAMRYGAVPIVQETGGLKDTVPPFNEQTGEGRGFTFQSFNSGDMLDALRRALAVYGGAPEKFAKVRDNGMREDFSWKVPAKEYRKLYTELTQKA